MVTTTTSSVRHRTGGLAARGLVALRIAVAASIVVPVVALTEDPAWAAPVTERASMHTDGTHPDGAVLEVAVSGDGDVVAFNSAATNLVNGDTNAIEDIFVRDRDTGATSRVSIHTDGTQANDTGTAGDLEDQGSWQPSVSGDGRYVAFASYADNLVDADINLSRDVFVRDRTNGTTERVSVTSEEVAVAGSSRRPSISSDGRYVAFEALAPLVVGDGNLKDDVFVRDRQAGTTVRVSKTTGGAEGDDDSEYADISDDGRYVVFRSRATNLVSGDTNGAWDIFLHDRDTDGDGTFDESGAISTTRISVASDGTQANGASTLGKIDADGSTVTFESSATNLVVGDTNSAGDVFVRQVGAGTTERVSLTDGEAQATASSSGPSISDDGRYVTFHSGASNLVPDDTNAAYDVFVRDLQEGTTTRVSVTGDGSQADRGGHSAWMGGAGCTVAFLSSSQNLDSPAEGDIDDDAFVREDTDICAGTATWPTTTTTTTTTVPPTTTTTTTVPPTTTTTTVPPTTTATTVPPTTTATTVPPTTTTTLVTVPATPVLPAEPDAGVDATNQAGELAAPPLVEVEFTRGQSDRGSETADAGDDEARTAPNGAESRWVRMSPRLMVLLGGLSIAGLVGGFFAMGILTAGSGFFLVPFWRRRRRDGGDEQDEGSQASTPSA